MVSSFLHPWWLAFLLLPLLFVYIDFAKNYKLQSFIREDIINFLMPKSKKIATDEEDPENELEDEIPASQKISEKERKDLVAKPRLWKKYGWLIIPYVAAVIAAAGPAVEQESDLFQTDENWVWAVDVSPSMLADDLKPNRFQRVRYSLIELLNASKSHRRISLLAYTSDVYQVTPATDDMSTILFSLQELSPEIMPTVGSDPVKAIKKAAEILSRDPETPGNILLVTDDVKSIEEENALVDFINGPECVYPVYIYAIGTSQGKPVKFHNEIMHDANGETVMARSHIDLLQDTAKKTESKIFFEIGEEAPHLEQMYSYDHPEHKKTEKSNYIKKDIGYWFLLISIVSCFGFIRNYFFSFIVAGLIGLSTLCLPSPAFAEVTEMTEFEGEKRPNEYGYLLYQDGQYEKALEYLKDRMWRGHAYYRLGKYDKAIPEYQALGNDAEAKYNIGNCFAHMQTPSALKDALLAYKQALEINPDHADASMNKTVIMEYLRKIEEMNAARKNVVIDESVVQSSTISSDSDSALLVELGEKDNIMQKRFILQQKKRPVSTPEQTW